MPHAKLHFHPLIQVTAESVATGLGVSIEKADRMLSGPETRAVLESALDQAFHETLGRVLREMARVPQEAMPTAIDCTVKIAPLAIKARFH